MKLLVLGGTLFLSRAVAADAVARGHDVTCAARGTSGSVPDGAQHVFLDRAAPDWSALEGEWDAVVDVARTPGWVADALDHLADAHWTFVSTISVYADHSIPGGTPETLPLLPPVTEDVEQDSAESYGSAKVACEQAVQARAPSRVRRTSRADHRPRRPERPVHLLARAALGGWRGAGPRVAGPRHPGDRRTRPGGVDRHRRGEAAHRRVRRDRRGAAARRPGRRGGRCRGRWRARCSGRRPTSCWSAA